MPTARDELRRFAHARRVVAIELLLGLAAVAGLFAASGRLDASGPEARVLFVLCLAAAVASAAETLPRLVEALLFRCPRCSGLFHAAMSSRLVLRLHACAHCRLPLDADAPARPSESA